MKQDKGGMKEFLNKVNREANSISASKTVEEKGEAWVKLRISTEKQAAAERDRQEKMLLLAADQDVKVSNRIVNNDMVMMITIMCRRR